VARERVKPHKGQPTCTVLTIRSVLLFGIVNGVDCESPTEQMNMLCCRMQSRYMLQDMVYVFNTGL